MSAIDKHLVHLDTSARSLTLLRNASAHALIKEPEVGVKVAWSTTLHAAQQALSIILECRRSLTLGDAGPQMPPPRSEAAVSWHLASIADSMSEVAAVDLWAQCQLGACQVLGLLPLLQFGFRHLGEDPLLANSACPMLPARPERLQIVDYVRYDIDRNYPRRKLHQQVFNVEVCAGEVCAMLVLRFAELPADIATSLTLQCVEEFRHAELLLDAQAAEGGQVGETPVSLGIWKNCRAAENAADCIGLEQVIGEGFSLGADLYYAELYRAIGRADIAALHECIYIDEVNHVRNGLTSFRRLLGKEADARLELLEKESKATVIGGRFFNEPARRYVGFSNVEIERQRLRSQPVELPDLKGVFG